ncbi:tyrosine-type recombinase/integrase [Variovorax sp. UC74_104]|uniref:tyrosine-type recombinase/integrase n=1 Tax=Variovorax sp. UC74_104 TaxID=3374555 RepID=UPI0037567FB1
MKRDLPPRVYEKNGSYYHVAALGEKRKWTKLCRIKEGLSSMYLALAKIETDKALDDMMPKVCADWMKEIGSKHGKKTQADHRTHNKAISEAFLEFRARDVTPPVVVEFLEPWDEQPRSYNAYRAALRERMRFAEVKGFRPAGSNPVDSVKTKKVKARTRYITDSELRRIKVAACYGDDGNRTRSGHTICCLIDMAYLTGQRISDLLGLEWTQIRKEGILFEPSKTEDTTAVRILIEWTPKLQAVIERLRHPPPVPGRRGKARKTKPVSMRYVFSTLKGEPYTYDGASTAWTRARERAKVKDAHFHDLRAKALTDIDGVSERGIGQAQTMGGHSTQTQTADYVRHKRAKKTGATR